MDNQGQNSFNYEPEEGSQQDFESSEPERRIQEVSWTGSEFIANHKNSNWFLGYFALLASVVALIFIFTRDYISTISVAIVGVMFAMLANHKPRQLAYKIDNSGISIGTRFYSFEKFKSFSLAFEGAIGYVNLMPMKRFMPDLSIYFPPEEAENVIQALSAHLPHNEASEHQVDRLAKKFHF